MKKYKCPVFEVFPTLERFAAQRYRPFRPRNEKSMMIAPGAHPSYPSSLRAQTLSNWYNDLGVMVFAGTTDQQTLEIAKLLRETNMLPDGLPSLEGAIYESERSDREPKLETKYLVYKISSDDVKLDQAWVSQEGELDSEDLYRLMKHVTSQYQNDIVEQIHRIEKSVPEVEFRLGTVSITRKAQMRGIIHPTVNGPRRLPIKAYVYTCPSAKTPELDISFYTTGTSLYLGSAKCELRLFIKDSKDGQLTRLRKSLLHEAIEGLPLRHIRGNAELRRITKQTWWLERQVWSKRWYENEENDKLGAELHRVHSAINKLDTEIGRLKGEILEWARLKKRIIDTNRIFEMAYANRLNKLEKQKRLDSTTTDIGGGTAQLSDSDTAVEEDLENRKHEGLDRVPANTESDDLAADLRFVASQR